LNKPARALADLERALQINKDDAEAQALKEEAESLLHIEGKISLTTKP
jgi:hypothetical protein